MMMPEQFAITDFIENRWSEASAELSRHDRAFFDAVSRYFRVKEAGLVLTENLPQPSHRLSAGWYELLESTMDVSQHLDRLDLTVRKIDEATDRKEADYYFETWVQDIYNLCEKIGRMISLSCSLHSLGRLKDKYRQELEEKVQYNTSRMRQALVHGADEPEKGGLGVSAIGITEDQLWEASVVVGPESIPYALEASHLKPPAWVRRTRPVTADILARLGDVLSGLDQNIVTVADRQ